MCVSQSTCQSSRRRHLLITLHPFSDSSLYDPSLASVEELDLSPTGGVYRTTYGPAWFEALKRLPASTQFVACLNFGNSSLEIASAQAEAAVRELGSQLYALECTSLRGRLDASSHASSADSSGAWSLQSATRCAPAITPSFTEAQAD